MRSGRLYRRRTLHSPDRVNIGTDKSHAHQRSRHTRAYDYNMLRCGYMLDNGSIRRLSTRDRSGRSGVAST